MSSSLLGVGARHLPVVVAALALVFVAFLAGCGGAQPGGGAGTNGGRPMTTAGMPVVLSVDEALAAGAGTVRVRGAVVATYPDDAARTGGDVPGIDGNGAEPTVVLASVLLESYPPQAGGATLPVAGLDLDALVGLSSTVGRAGSAPVVWSDYQVVLEGTISDGVLRVGTIPAAVEAVTSGIRLRFSAVGEPIMTGETAWWAFDITNRTDVAVELTFVSGQRGEVVLCQKGVERYRWSADRVFIQAIEAATIAPGEVMPIVLNDAITVAPGRYDLVASIPATAAVNGRTLTLPKLTGTIGVY